MLFPDEIETIRNTVSNVKALIQRYKPKREQLNLVHVDRTFFFFTHFKTTRAAGEYREAVLHSIKTHPRTRIIDRIVSCNHSQIFSVASFSS